MTSNKSQDVNVNNEAQIRALIERWAKAVREENRAAILADHDSDILMFDVPPPFLSRGLEAYMATWETFFSSVEKPVTFDFHLGDHPKPAIDDQVKSGHREKA
jgi:ketosteroid isomerase-like protein